MATIPVAAPVREQRELAAEIDDAVRRVVRSGRYVMGPEHDAFEREFADHIGAHHGVATANGTDSLEVALRAVGCGPGDHVIMAANAGGYAACAAVAVGAQPLYAEVDPSHLLLSLADVDRLVGTGPAAVVVTHLYGALHPDIGALAERCRLAGVPLVEDCAQATGSRDGSRHAGTFGAVATHSFYPTKNLGALGDGGMVTTDDDALADRLRALRQYGWARPQVGALSGGRNSRLDEVQAAVLRVKLRHLGDRVDRRRRVVDRYRAATPGRWWAGSADPTYSAHLAVTRTADRDRLRADAEAAGIATAVHFPIPDHRQASLPDADRDLPVTESACSEVVTLPCHPFLDDDEVDRVVRFLERCK